MDNVKTINVPQYKNLSTKEILVFAAESGQVEHYLPDDCDIEKLPKQWLCNICAAVLGSAFRQWVSLRIEARNAEMAETRDMMIHMDPMMAAKFEASTHVSCKYIHQLINN